MLVPSPFPKLVLFSFWAKNCVPLLIWEGTVTRSLQLEPKLFCGIFSIHMGRFLCKSFKDYFTGWLKQHQRKKYWKVSAHPVYSVYLVSPPATKEIGASGSRDRIPPGYWEVAFKCTCVHTYIHTYVGFKWMAKNGNKAHFQIHAQGDITIEILIFLWIEHATEQDLRMHTDDSRYISW
jgi:hypothetical protein